MMKYQSEYEKFVQKWAPEYKDYLDRINEADKECAWDQLNFQVEYIKMIANASSMIVFAIVVMRWKDARWI